jgi:hypothetical protein
VGEAPNEWFNAFLSLGVLEEKWLSLIGDFNLLRGDFDRFASILLMTFSLSFLVVSAFSS